MTQYGTWVSYGGTADIVLAAALAGAAAAAAYAGFRVPLPAPLPRPRRTARIFLLVAWLLSIAAFVVCFALLHNARGWRVALGSAVIGALAAPMIFEFPFDLIVMTRVYPPMPPHPALYLALFFIPLILVELTTVARLTLSPVVRVSRATFWCFAAMLAVFAVWGLIGFGYPSSPAPFALNVASKILAFLTVLSMFLPDRSQPTTLELEPTPQAWTSVI